MQPTWENAFENMNICDLKTERWKLASPNKSSKKHKGFKRWAVSVL